MPPAPPLAVDPELVVTLAVTGTEANALALASSLLLAIGGVLTVAARRSRRDYYDT